MSTKETGNVDSVRKQWTKQRKGEGARFSGASTSAHGSHFASPVSSQATEGVEQPAHRSPIKITGASGEMPAVPVRVKQPQISSYSRYNGRYTEHAHASGINQSVPSTPSLVVKPADGELAYMWTPFVVYAAVSVIASIAWAAYTIVNASGALAAGGFELTMGLFVLCCIVLAGIAVVVISSLVTLKTNETLDKTDVAAAALGKGALMMFVSVVVWIVATVVTTAVVA